MLDRAETVVWHDKVLYFRPPVTIHQVILIYCYCVLAVYISITARHSHKSLLLSALNFVEWDGIYMYMRSLVLVSVVGVLPHVWI